MTEKLIHCPECNSENLNNSVYCCQCGSPIIEGMPVRMRKTPWIAIVVIVLALSFAMTSAIQFFKSQSAGRQTVEQQKQGELIHPAATNQTSPPPDLNVKNFSASPNEKGKQEPAAIDQVTVGMVSIINPDGFMVAEHPAAIVSGSWLALPARACIGGDRWLFKAEKDKEIPIEGGLWGTGDTVGFWRLAGEKKYTGPSFATWVQERPVRLLSIVTGKLSEPITLTPSGIQGAFIYSSLPANTDPGVFIQNGMVVGWSFGEVLAGAYMWTLGSDPDILYTNYVDDFYRETFAGGREEYFTVALTRESISSAPRQLQIFTEGFRYPAKIQPEDLPGYLRTESVFPYISKLVSYLMKQGAYHYVATLTGEPLLWEMNDPEILKNVILATRNIYGTESAVNFIEESGLELMQNMKGDTAELRQLHLALYITWVKALLDNSDNLQARQVYNIASSQFDVVPELHLLAVELALAERDWIGAENLLNQKEYPATLRETRLRLAERISELKGQENKIVIQFEPGTREVPVNVTLNDRLDHTFIVDTGASFVTIPYSTVEALDLEDKMSQHQQEVQTAGGTVYANAVTLPSIELQGWVVSNVKALVIDLPDRPDLGLLGLNFLNRFRMELQADRGVLTLEPK